MPSAVSLDSTGSEDDAASESCGSDRCGPRRGEDLNSNHLTIWRDAFDLRQLPQSITLDLIKRAPFLMGSDNARYSKDFFRTVGGLCATGISYQNLMANHGVPLEDLLGTYPLSKVGNRHPMKLITDRTAARDALYMYQRVYGGTQPENGEFGTSFIRGLALFYQHNMKVDWAEQAASIAKKRMGNLGRNPQKLTPPCFREQIQAMIDLFQECLSRTHKPLNAAVRQAIHPAPAHRPRDVRPHRDLQVVPANQAREVKIHRDGRAAPANQARALKIHGQAAVATPRQNDVPNEEVFRQQKTRSLVIRPPRPEVNPTTAVGERDALHALLEKRHVLERTYLDGLKKLEDAKQLLTQQHLEQTKLEKAEEEHWDNMISRQVSKRGGDLRPEERAEVDKQVRAATAAAHQVSVKLAAVGIEIGKTTLQVSKLEGLTCTLEDELGEVSSQVDVLIIESSYIRPQQLFSALPTTLEGMLPLQQELPCMLCSRFWADMAMVNLPCGCFLHPSCMFKVCLSKEPKCPNYSNVPGGVWMG
jgi:hypothetical protein